MDFLVIDDDKTFRDATCFLIEEAGHYAEGVESGQLGLNWLKEDKWDAVLLDVNLGRENGLDVLVETQKQFPAAAVVMFAEQANGEDSVPAGALISLEKLEEAHLRKILERTPSLTEAAEILNIDQATLHHKRKKIGLE
jgi:two-component system, NtrC family, response regulator AlgB